ncbi:MAG: DUF5683 domain-containing protein, partial [Balneolaceae bacterium]
MKKLPFILMLLIPLYSQAQKVDNFSNGIFKHIEKKEVSKSSIHISDFKYQNNNYSQKSFLKAPRTKPVVAFAASALIPGSGQAVNGKWVRAGVYFTAEVIGIVYHLDRNAKAKRQEEAYESFTHENWSVVAYSQWLVRYSDANYLNQNGLEDLRNQVFDDNGNPI